jgi:Zn-dependent peptidase ImmA (M78 family)
VAGRDTNIGAKRAREAREQLGLAPDAPVRCILHSVEADLALPVVVCELPEAVAGVCWRGERGETLLWVNGTQAVVRRRFTLAHELGHVRCGHDRELPFETYETLSGRDTNSREVQANAFAAELLMPRAGVPGIVSDKPTLEDVVRLAAHFGVSAIAALYRLSTLELVAQTRYRRLKRELDEGLVDELWKRLAPAPFEDGLSAIASGELPRLSPQLAPGGLDALARRSASVSGVAAAAGCDADALAGGAGLIGI